MTTLTFIKFLLLFIFATLAYIGWQQRKKVSLEQLAKDMQPPNYDDMDFIAAMPPETDDVIQLMIRRLIKAPADAWKLRRNATLLLQATHGMERRLKGEAADILQQVREAAIHVQRESLLVEAELQENRLCLHGQPLIRAYVRMFDALTYLSEIAV